LEIHLYMQENMAFIKKIESLLKSPRYGGAFYLPSKSHIIII
jgi:hypothetical protein